MTVNELVKNETVRQAAMDLAAKRELTAANLSKKLFDENGMEVGGTQINNATKRLKQDQIVAQLSANAKKDRERMQRAARRAQEKKNAEKPPEIE